MITVRPTMLVMFLALCSYSAHAIEFCRAGEMVVWGCLSKSKTYAVCASNDLSRDNGYIQYRAVKKGRVEFEYPEVKDKSQRKFKFFLQPQGAVLSFDNGEYRYEAYEGLKGQPGINVSKGGKEVAAIECSSGAYTLTQTNVQNALENAGLGE